MTTAVRPEHVEFLPDGFVRIDGVELPLPHKALESRVSHDVRRGRSHGALGLVVSVEAGRVSHEFVADGLAPVSTDLASVPDVCSLEEAAAAVARRRDELPSRIVPEYGSVGAARPAFLEARAWYHPRLVGLPEVDIFVWDYRGIAAFLFDDEPTPWMPRRSLGGDLAALMLSTRIPGERYRRDQSLVRLGANVEVDGTARQFIAGAAAEYFMSEAVERDGGVPVLGFYITIETAERTEVVIPDSLLTDAGERARRLAGLGDAVRNAIVQDAFGTGIDSARSNRSKVSMDDRDDSSDQLREAPFDEILAGQLDALTRLARLEERLRDDESALLRARLSNPDASLTAIAEEHGWNEATVRAVWRRIKNRARSLN